MIGSAGTAVGKVFGATCLAAATLAANMALASANYSYGLSQGSDAVKDFYFFTITEAQQFGLLGVAGDVMLWIAPTLTVWAISKRDIGRAVIYGLLSAFCMLWVLTGFLGFLTTTRDNAAAAAGQSQTGFVMLEDRIASLIKQRGMVPTHRDAAIVAARISEKEGDAIWTRTQQCTNVTLEDSRRFCDDYRALKVEAVAAGRAAELNEKIEDARRELSRTKRAGTVDGLADLFSRRIGLVQGDTNDGRIALIAIATILISAFGFTGICDLFASKPVQAASRQEIQPVQGLTIEIPAPAPSLQIAAPEHQEASVELEPEEKAPEPECGHVPDKKVAVLVRKAITPEQGVEEWARQMDEGWTLFEEMKPLYLKFCERRQIPAYKPIAQLGSVLRALGYVEKKISAQKGKKAFLFPLQAAAKKVKVKA